MSTREITIHATHTDLESTMSLLRFYTAPSGPGCALQCEIVPESLPFFQRATVGMIIVDSHFVVTRANRAFARILHTTMRQLERSSLIELTHPEDIDSDALNRHALVSRQIDGYATEKRLLRRDGVARLVKLTYSRIQSAFTGSGFLVCVEEAEDQQSAANQ
jgi:PAS domain S-box-containing protein